MNATERAMALLTARLLRATRTLDWLSIGLTLLGVGALLFGSAHLLFVTIAIFLGVVARLYAARIDLDARLFEDLAEERLSLSDLDSALSSVLSMSRPGPPRAVADRCRGARRLIAIAGLLVAAQLLALGLSIVAR